MLASTFPCVITTPLGSAVVPEAADGVARFSFEELCGRPLGARDYLKLAEAFHTIILADVPVLAPSHRDEAKRLINLIDTLYDRRTRLIVSAEAEPGALWQARDGAESFEFARKLERRFGNSPVAPTLDAVSAAVNIGGIKTMLQKDVQVIGKRIPFHCCRQLPLRPSPVLHPAHRQRD